MAGYTPPPGLYFSDTFCLYQGSASANVNFPIGRNTVAGVSYNFLFDIAQVAWVTDVKVLGGSLGSTGFAPTGFYSSTALAFTGLHRPGVDLKGGYTYLSLQTGIEASAALGVTVNMINTATNSRPASAATITSK